MNQPMIEVENLSKLYRLGSIGSTTLQESLNRRWYRLIGKEELGRRIGEKDLMIPPDHPQAGPEPNTFWALKDVSFTVEQGDIVGIIGRNGAGKSTLLRVLTRITEPTSGRAVLRGRVGSLLEVGTGFHPELTGRENIFLNGAILGMRRREIERKFDEIVAFAEVERFIDTPVKRYSSGMYVRLAFAVAAHLDPEILLVDEVLAVGDAAFQTKCLGKMKDVAGEGRTVLFVSHNMAAVQQLCPRAVLLQNGEIAFEGRTPHAISAYVRATDRTEEQPGRAVRSSGGELEVTMVRILDEYDRESEVAVSGQPLVVAVSVNAQESIDAVVVQVAICGRYQERVTLLNNRMSGHPIDLPAGPSEVRCRVEKNPLTAGDYTVEAKILRHSEHLVQMETACGFQVVDGDFFGTGQAPAHGWGGAFLCEHVWAVHKGWPATNVQKGKATV